MAISPSRSKHRIPWVLSLAGLYIEKKEEGAPEPDENSPITKIIKDHLELMAREEHDLWMHHKLQNGWTCAPKDNTDDKKTLYKLKLHKCLKPFEELPEDDKQKDRDAVTNYPTIADRAGFKIVAERPETSP